ncbi:MAG TPA: NAD(P)H-hydrate dehydratase [Flavobacteriaceae bacterium]|nr:NAD(P)H-hydrate dehydratase [Flavobacteriaceae bacterium]
MKIYTAQQIGKADKATLKSQDITSLELMERAAVLAFSTLIKKYKNKTVGFQVFCGIGNNGGDGLVIARKILEYGYEVKVFVVEYSKYYSPEFETNLNRIKNEYDLKIDFLNEKSKKPALKKADVLIDAIFGIGLNRAMPIWVQDLVEQINDSKCEVIAIDLPTGMLANLPKLPDQPIIRASKTLTFQAPKLSFYLPETTEYTGKVKILDIGLDQEFLEALNSTIQVIEKKFLKSIYKKRPQFSHKGSFGHALIVGGSYGMIGSMVLASKAALRSGAGKVTTLIPKCGYEILQIAVPEAMTITGENEQYLQNLEKLDFQPKTICFGMGAGTKKETADFFLDLMKSTENPLVIDADGLNLLSKHKFLLEFIPKNSVLTPHPKELERLIGKWDSDIEKIDKTQNFAIKHQVVMLIKGANTLIITPEQIFINTTGNPGMATAGSGDVLSGVIAGLLAQNYSPENAAVLGVWLHGKAGDLSVKKSAEEALIAGDLIAYFGKAFSILK